MILKCHPCHPFINEQPVCEDGHRVYLEEGGGPV